MTEVSERKGFIDKDWLIFTAKITITLILGGIALFVLEVVFA